MDWTEGIWADDCAPSIIGTFMRRNTPKSGRNGTKTSKIIDFSVMLYTGKKSAMARVSLITTNPCVCPTIRFPF
jgi:hypothetical protein